MAPDSSAEVELAAWNSTQLRAKAAAPVPKAIGIEEISIRKGHTRRIAVSDAYDRDIRPRHPAPSSL